MGKATGIAWCDSTWNPWIGCTKVSPGCDHCYAEALDNRHRYGGATHWGPGVPRYRTKSWGQPLAWNKKAAATGQRWTVFPSLCDPFDNEVPAMWRMDFFDLIRKTPALTWLLLTKRIGNAEEMLPGGWYGSSEVPYCGPFQNVWIGASIVNQEEADRDIPKLLATPAAKRFVSYEPALGPVDFEAHLWRAMATSEIPGWALNDGCTSGVTPRHKIHQIIVGGESDQGAKKARPFDIAWAHSTIAQCRDAGVPVFVKQLGSHPCRSEPGAVTSWFYKDRAGADPAEWPAGIRVQEFPA